MNILYYKYADESTPAEYAVDLSRHTSPYQVVLALVPPQDTLHRAMDFARQKISEFTHNPQYETLRKLRPSAGFVRADTLIIPDVLYKLRHHFEELEGKGFGNRQLGGYFIFQAMQMIDFALSRTGVVLKSEASLIAAPFSTPPPEPRKFHFDRPFLIYVKKRGEEFSPFFVMWVDNAELMEKF